MYFVRTSISISIDTVGEFRSKLCYNRIWFMSQLLRMSTFDNGANISLNILRGRRRKIVQ